MKTLILCLVTMVSISPAIQAQKLDDFLKAFGEELEKAAEQELNNYVENQFAAIDNECRAKQNLAKVDEFDASRIGTWAIQTKYGKKYQVRSVGFAGTTTDGKRIDDYLALAQALSFTFSRAEDRVRVYNLHIGYSDVARGESLTGSLLASAFNSTLQRELPNNFQYKIFGVGGKTLSGTDWCFCIVDDDHIKSARLITGD